MSDNPQVKKVAQAIWQMYATTNVWVVASDDDRYRDPTWRTLYRILPAARTEEPQ